MNAFGREDVPGRRSLCGPVRFFLLQREKLLNHDISYYISHKCWFRLGEKVPQAASPRKGAGKKRWAGTGRKDETDVPQ